MYKKRTTADAGDNSSLYRIVAIALGAHYLYLMKRERVMLWYLIRIVIPVVNLILLLLASRGIKKDDDLVKSYDRLR